MSSPDVIHGEVNSVNYNPRWQQLVLVVAVNGLTFIVTLSLLIIHIPTMVLMQDLPKDWRGGFVLACITLGLSALTCLQTIMFLFMLLKSRLSPGTVIPLISVGLVIWTGVTTATAVWAKSNRKRVCSSVIRPSWACKYLHWVFILEGMLLCLQIVLLVVSTHAAHVKTKQSRTSKLRKVNKSLTELRMVGPALTPPVNIPTISDRAYIKKLSTQKFSEAEVDYLHTVIWPSRSIAVQNNENQTLHSDLRTQQLETKKHRHILPKQLNSTNLGFKPGRLLFGPSLVEQRIAPDKKIDNKTTAALAVTSNRLVASGATYQHGDAEEDTRRDTERPVGRNSQYSIAASNVSVSSPGGATNHYHHCRDNGDHQNALPHEPPVGAQTSILQTEAAERIMTTDKADLRLHKFPDRPFSFASSIHDSSYGVHAGASGIILAPSPRGCSMVNIQKLIHRNGTVSSMSSSGSDTAVPLSPEGLACDEPQINTGIWRFNQYEQKPLKIELSSHEIVIAPLNISSPRNKPKITVATEENATFSNGLYQEHKIGSSHRVTHPQPIPPQFCSPMRNITLNTRDPPALQTRRFTTHIMPDSSAQISTPGYRNTTHVAPLRTQMVGHFTVSSSGAVEFNDTPRDFNLPIGEWNSKGRWVGSDGYDGSMQNDWTMSGDSDSDPFRFEAEVKAMTCKDGGRAEADACRTKAVRFNV